MKTWLKGGIIGLILSIIYISALFFLQMNNLGRDLLPGGLNYLFYPVGLITNWYCKIFTQCVSSGWEAMCSCNVFIPWIIFVLIITIVGGLIGKIKNK